ncbi:MAG: cupin domain-containing protein [Armatimonadota bacterium]|nr:cupin domain-containing protein [Armatimonadota bacterium]MDR7519638.1 cupin domain-containing protein [Armatimonadota bacterium]
MTARSRPTVVRFDPQHFRWAGVPPKPYRSHPDGGRAWKGVERFVLVGAAGEPTAFHLRYFEIAPGGYSSWERHRHAHAVLVVRGRGRVRLGKAVHRVRPMDFIYIPAEVPHQFIAGRQPFGFLCPVDAVRDRPRPAARPVARPHSQRSPGRRAASSRRRLRPGGPGATI